MTEYESQTALEPTPGKEDDLLLYPVPSEPLPSGTAVIFSIIAFACGILSLCTLWIGLDFAIAGLIFAMLSKRRTGGRPLPKAKRGKILSIIGLVISSIWTLVYILYSLQDFAAQMEEFMSTLP